VPTPMAGHRAVVATPTLGIEEEFLLVDARTGAPSGDGDRIAAEAAGAGDDNVEHELRTAMVETGSAVCPDLDSASAELRRHRRSVVDAASTTGSAVLASGSHPTASPEDAPFTHNERYQRMARIFGATASGALVCGCHVHVAVPDRETGVAVLDRVRPWLAVLLALSGNSPLWRGADSGFASWRQQVWGRWPHGRPDRRLRLIAGLRAAGAHADRHRRSPRRGNALLRRPALGQLPDG
jgi:carboxylate-amine ligase